MRRVVVSAVAVALLATHAGELGAAAEDARGAAADSGAAPAASGERAPAARRYRALTEHSPVSVRSGGHRRDRRNRPALYRAYPGAPTVALPPPLRLGALALDVIGAAEPAPDAAAPPLDLARLGTVLFLGGGISGRRRHGGDVRVTAAAGALYPNELYVVSGPLGDLAAGVYHYDPRRALLSRLRAGDWRAALAAAAADARVAGAPATLVLTGILWRSAWKYRERAYRHLYWDGGMVAAHLLAAATAARLPATLLGGFVDADVDRLLGIDGRREKSLALVPLGAPVDGAAATPAASPRAGPPPLDVRPTALSRRPIDYPEALRYHAASRLDDPAAVRRLRAAAVRPRPGQTSAAPPVALPPPAAAERSPSIDAVVRRRRSTRRFATRPITAAELAAVLERPTRGVAADFLSAQPSLIETYVIVNAVEGVPPGAYRYERETHRLEALARGDFRETAGFLALEQALARDASAVLFYLTDLDAVLAAFGERGYRLAELEGGLLAGRAYLAAYALGRGATGLTFYDQEVTRFFAPRAAGLAPLLVVAVGVPAKRR